MRQARTRWFLVLVAMLAFRCGGAERSSVEEGQTLIPVEDPPSVEVDIDFFVLLHTGEGQPPRCGALVTDARLCYANHVGLDDDALAMQCASEELALAACETTTDASGRDIERIDKSCKLENFDRRLDRTDADYDPQLAIRYTQCRDGLIRVLEGLAQLGVPTTVQFHGGFLQNLIDEDASGGPFDFEEHLVGLGHEISLHHHTECDLSSAPSAWCPDLGPRLSSFGTAWSTNAEDITPSQQALVDARVVSLLEVESYGRSLSTGYYAATQHASTSICGWGIPYRVHQDLDAVAANPALVLEDQDQFAALAAAGIEVLTTTNEFAVDLEPGCHDGRSTELADMRRSIPHAIELSDGLMFYPSPAPLFGQPTNPDPLASDSDSRDEFASYLACVDARVAQRAVPSSSIVRWSGHDFLWSGTTHLHNMIEGDWDVLPGDPSGSATWPSGVVEIAGYQAMMQQEIAAYNAVSTSAATITGVSYQTLSDIEDARDRTLDWSFPVQP